MSIACGPAAIRIAQTPSSGGVVGWVTGLMESLGGPGVGLAVALESFFPPIPSEVILPLAGFAVSRGEIGLASALAWTTVGSTVGAVVLYLLGALVGRERIRAAVARVPLLRVSDVDRAEEWFRRHGSATVFFGRMVPGVRSFISIPAGVERMPVRRFVLLTALGSTIWNAALVSAGYLLGESWHVVGDYAGTASTVVLVAVGLGIVVFVVVRMVGSGRTAEPDDDGG